LVLPWGAKLVKNFVFFLIKNFFKDKIYFFQNGCG